ncbi:MAG: acyltransferase [Pseudomonadota bacterium]
MKDNSTESQQTSVNTSHHMPALTGVRFFAVFHIFLFHMFAWYWAPKPEGLENMLIGLADAPLTMVKFASNGWMSTSFFFLLSGFILAYLYWGEDGKLVMTRRRFWSTRAARIYPIHLLVLGIIIGGTTPYQLEQGTSPDLLISSALGTAALVQAWVPTWVPVWSWPTWTLSVLVFLYLVMPWLMRVFAKMTRPQMIATLIAMPFISSLPTAVYAAWLASGAEPTMNVDILVANNPVFWIPYFATGMLMTRVFAISRFQPAQRSPSWFSWGDAAVLAILAVALTQFIDQPWKFFIRQGALMPLFIVIVLDLARGRGMMSKVFSLPGTGFLGETGFSLFIWQSFVVLIMYATILAMPDIGPYQHWIAIGLVVLLAIASTYLVEKPISSWIRRRFIDRPPGKHPS